MKFTQGKFQGSRGKLKAGKRKFSVKSKKKENPQYNFPSIFLEPNGFSNFPLILKYSQPEKHLKLKDSKIK